MTNERHRHHSSSSSNNNSDDPLLACPVCGVAARRASARFCHACGRESNAAHHAQHRASIKSVSAEYVPTGDLRASYTPPRRRATHKPTPYQPVPYKPAVSNSASVRTAHPQAYHGGFEVLSNRRAALALACVAYSLIPFVGLIFCPIAIALGAVAALRAEQMPEHDGLRAAVFSFFAGLVAFFVQLMLWFMLLILPEWLML